MYVFDLTFKQFVQKYGSDRKEVVRQLKNYLPALPKNVVFYAETDGLSAYGPNLPFLTSVAQAITVAYYDKSPLPDSFFEKQIFDGKGEGYLYSEGRGFGYYTSRKTLSEAVLAGDFEVSDIYAFYYEAQKVKVRDITFEIRKEMEDYLGDAHENSDWETFTDSSGFSFSYPPQTIIAQDASLFRLENPFFTADIIVINISPNFDINEYVKIRQAGSLNEIVSKKVSFDKFHYHDGLVIMGQLKNQYLIKLDDRLIQLETGNKDKDSIENIEKILGSIELIEKE